MNTGTCPRCLQRLERIATPGGGRERCPGCRGQALSATVLAKATTPDVVRSLLIAASGAARAAQPDEGSLSDTGPTGTTSPGAPCPWCAAPMLEIAAVTDDQLDVQLDVCGICQLLWFDPGELDRLPKSNSTVFAGPRIDEIQCGHCGAPSRPDLDSYCKYCHQPMAPARTPGVTQSSIVPLPPVEDERPPSAADWIGGLLRLLG